MSGTTRATTIGKVIGRELGRVDARSENRNRSIYRVSKRSVDLLGSALGLFLLAPLMFVVALMIKLTSPGPIIFKQLRLGVGGREFWCYKFRTMVMDAELRLKDLERFNESSGSVLFKMKHDPRLTPIGSFLRRSSIDELPQLFNVLIGDMALVGPRPLQLRDCALLNECMPDVFAKRLEVVPGLTGPWQISGRSEIGFDDMVKLDTNYVDNRTMLMDLKIILVTLKVVFSRRGAY